MPRQLFHEVLKFTVAPGIGRKLHGFVERTARACAEAGEVESSSSSNHTSILHPVEEFLRALVNPSGLLNHVFCKTKTLLSLQLCS